MEHLLRRVLSGQQAGPMAAALRAVLRVVEPIYATVAASRNRSYEAGMLRSYRAARPVISVGNITTGGTGKTPVVRWLAERLRARGFRPAVLMRGYKAQRGERSDEQVLLDQLLNATRPAHRPDGATVPTIPVHANRDRVAGAAELVERNPEVNVILLDDGFQHRRLQRDFDLVLIDATNPFGFDHVLPRGLLREPLHGLSRASAVVLTRVDQALPGELDEIERDVRRRSARVPIYRSTHAHAAIVCEDGGATVSRPMRQLHGQRVYAFCGIGNPEAFGRQLTAGGAEVVGHQWFGDHHQYDAQDLVALRTAAARAGAIALIATEKDWVKLAALEPVASPAGATSLPVWRVRLEVEFLHDDGDRLLTQILNTLAPGR